MKLAPREIESFLSAPPSAMRVFVFYGPDQGLVNDRMRKMAAKFAPDLDDPFCVAWLEGDALAKDPDRLIAEAMQMPLLGGERLVLVRGADDKAAKALEGLLLLQNLSARVVIAADDLGAKSALRKLAEAAQNAAAIPCYVEDAGQVAQYATRMLAQAGWSLSRDAAQWFGQNLSGDRGQVEQEIQKLITYLGVPTGGQQSAVDMDTLRGIAGGGSALDEDVFLDALGTPQALPMVQKLILEGQPVTNIIRTMGRHVMRLYQTQLRIQGGDDMKSAMDALVPKVFFKREAVFRAQLQKFSLRMLARLRSELWRIERECKQTGAPDELLLRQLILRLTPQPRAA